MKLSFRNRIIVTIVFASLICALSGVLITNQSIFSQGEDDLVGKSRAVLSRLEAVRDFVATQGGLDFVVDRMAKQFPDGKLSEEAKRDVLKQVPIFASMRIGSQDADKENYQFRIFSDEPRSEKHKASAEELEIFRKFEKDSALKEIVEKKSGKVAVFRPVYLSQKQGCLTCHGSPDTSPWKNGKDVLGFPMENWKDGKLHGVFGVISDVGPVKAAAMGSTWKISGLSLIGVLVALIFGYVLLKTQMNQLSLVSHNLKESGGQLSQASHEIAQSSHSLSQASAQAAASLEETTASTEEMSSMIRLNAQNAEEAKKLSEECERKARQGFQEVRQLIGAMGDITQASKKIEEIISVIDDIAFQTNLLALNAAVESARAGEQGKGFAVVAEAVRALAQRSASSAKEISTLIQSSVQGIDHVAQIAEKSGSSLQEIVQSVEKMSHLNAEISTASQEQAQGVQSINQTINDLDQVTQQNASASEMTANSSAQLRNQSETLHGFVMNLIEVLDGKESA